MAVVLVAVCSPGRSKSVEARSYRAVADGMDVHRDAGGVELGDKPREALRVEIELTDMLGRFAIGVEIG